MSNDEFEPVVLSESEVQQLSDAEVALQYLRASVQLEAGSLIDDPRARDVSETQDLLSHQLDERDCWDIVYPDGPDTNKLDRIEELE